MFKFQGRGRGLGGLEHGGVLSDENRQRCTTFGIGSEVS